MRRGLQQAMVLLTLIILCGQNLFSQTRPVWADGYFEDAENSYIEVVSASSREAEDAHNKAIQALLNRRSVASGVDANIVIKDGSIIVESSHDIIAKIRILDEYTEHPVPGTYTVYLLVQTAKNPSLEMENVSFTYTYPFSWRVFIPGCAQIYKGSQAKGYGFIAAECVFAAGITVTECLRKFYVKQSEVSSDTEGKKDMAKSAGCEVARNVAIAGLVGVYVWNLIDGIVANGNRHLQVGRTQMSVMPFASPDVLGCNLRVEF